MFKSIENLIKLTFFGVICLMGPLGQTGSVGILRIDQGFGSGYIWAKYYDMFFYEYKNFMLSSNSYN